MIPAKYKPGRVMLAGLPPPQVRAVDSLRALRLGYSVEGKWQGDVVLSRDTGNSIIRQRVNAGGRIMTCRSGSLSVIHPARN